MYNTHSRLWVFFCKFILFSRVVNWRTKQEQKANSFALCLARRKKTKSILGCNFAAQIKINKNMKVYVLTMTSQLGLFAISEGRTKLACVMLSEAKNLTEGKKSDQPSSSVLGGVWKPRASRAGASWSNSSRGGGVCGELRRSSHARHQFRCTNHLSLRWFVLDTCSIAREWDIVGTYGSCVRSICIKTTCKSKSFFVSLQRNFLK